MSALSIPSALAIALHCAPMMDPAMLVGIARQESALDPLTLRDDSTGEVLRGVGVVEAARRRIAAGHSVDLGLWQINSHNLMLLALGVAEAFEPCPAAAAAARLIKLYSRYNTGAPKRGIANGYAAAVMASIRAVKAAAPAAPAAAAAPVRRTGDTPPGSPPDPFARPVPTGPDLIFATARK
jgi:type IV secretion system protein VirB1